MKKRTVVVTSLSPRNVEYQAMCLCSWSSVSSLLVSFNGTEEAATIRASVNQLDRPIEIVEVEETAIRLFNKPLVFIDSFLDWFIQSDFERLIIVNSDIFLSCVERFQRLCEANNCDLLFGRRLDVVDLGDSAGSLFDGFDYFVLSKDGAKNYPRSHFCMGAPWWDHWMPLVQLASGRRIRLCEEGVVKHKIHQNQWGLQTQIPLAMELGNKLIELFMRSCAGGDNDPETNQLLGLSSLFAEYFVMSRDFYNYHYSQITKYTAETQQALLHEICWRMPQVVLRYIFAVAPRCGDAIVGHTKEIPLQFR